MSLLNWLGFVPSEEDKKLKQLIQNSYSSVQVVGRGTVKIDPNEVSRTPEFKRAREEARKIVSS